MEAKIIQTEKSAGDLLESSEKKLASLLAY